MNCLAFGHMNSTLHHIPNPPSRPSDERWNAISYYELSGRETHTQKTLVRSQISRVKDNKFSGKIFSFYEPLFIKGREGWWGALGIFGFLVRYPVFTLYSSENPHN